MRVFVYESMTGGSMLHASPSAPNGSLLAEGRAMLTAVAEDFSKLDNTEVVCLWDQRLPQPDGRDVEFVAVDSPAHESEQFDLLASNCDNTLLIAPELNGELLARTRRVEQLGGRLLSPDSRFVELATSKYETTRHLARAEVRVPPTVLYNDATNDPITIDPPWVVKPDDGAGSIGVRRIENSIDPSALLDGAKAICIQRYCPGRPASVAVLCGPHPSVLFPACWQNQRPPRFEYLGGSVIGDVQLGARAADLARAVVEALPNTRGLIGVDLILGDPMDGSADYVMEVNPRLTTSYIGLRRLCHQNLAHAMLSASNGDETTLSFRPDRLEFSACG